MGSLHGDQAAGAVGLFVVLVELALVVVMSVAGWKLFTKPGKPGWAAIAPICNAVVFLEIVGKRCGRSC